MSGICAVWRKDNLEGLAETVTAVCSGLALRGGERCSRAIDRTAAIAISGAFDTQQIFQNARVLVACDADLYNENELRAAANEIRQLPPDSLTAALIAALYEKRGCAFVKQLRGAFSVVLWDRVERKLFAAIDRFGMKRLVYYQDAKVLLLATRIEALARSRAFDLDIDPRAIANVLNYSANLGPLTTFRNVFRLLPGTLLLAAHAGTRLETYWDMQYGTESDPNEHFLTRKLESVVEESVAAHCKNDSFNHLGAFLSGGTDSSTIVGMMARTGRGPVRAFSIGFQEQRFNELGYARITAKKFGAEHHTLLVGPQDCLQVLPKMVRSFDEPFGNSSAVATYFCARLAAQNGVRVLLAGDGGDELFGGNEWYLTDKIFQAYSLIPAVFRKRLLEPMLHHLPMDGGVVARARRYVRRANTPPLERLFSYNFLYKHNPAEVLENGFLQALAGYSFLETPSRYFNTAPAGDLLDRVLYVDIKTTIGDNDLPKVTCMSELAGIQSRFPFLDATVAEFSGRIPAKWKLKGLQKRYLFKQAFRNLLPIEVIKKKKHGFGIPVALWLKTDPHLREFSRDILFSSRSRERGYFRRQFIEDLIRQHEADDSNYYGDTLWVFFVLELWHLQFVDELAKVMA
jgi:asparagine synthase (glutamine-hydrolysing)